MTGWGTGEWAGGFLLWGGGYGDFAPIDITYLRGSLSSVLERASYGSAITPTGSYRGVYADVNEVHVISGTGGYATVVSKPAEYEPTYAKVGTP